MAQCWLIAATEPVVAELDKDAASELLPAIVISESAETEYVHVSRNVHTNEKV